MAGSHPNFLVWTERCLTFRGEASRDPLVSQRIGGRPARESSCVARRGAPSAKEPWTPTHSCLGDELGSADSRFLGRRQADCAKRRDRCGAFLGMTDGCCPCDQSTKNQIPRSAARRCAKRRDRRGAFLGMTDGCCPFNQSMKSQIHPSAPKGCAKRPDRRGAFLGMTDGCCPCTQSTKNQIPLSAPKGAAKRWDQRSAFLGMTDGHSY